MTTRLVLAPVVVAALLAPGGRARPAPGAPGTRVSAGAVVTVVAAEYRFSLPASVAAGPTTFRLVNRGREVHHVTLIRLLDGKTLADLEALLPKGPPLPAWAIAVGGPNAANPGGTSEALVVLEPGRYAVLCFVPAPDGAPHAMKGMVQELEVTAAEGKAAPEETPDIRMDLANYAFSASTPLTAGRHLLRVRNTDRQWHELVLFRLAPGKTARDFVAWAEAMNTPPPGTFQGGVSPLAPGLENDVPLRLDRGRYVLVCFLEDATDGKPHFMHGMVQELQVD